MGKILILGNNPNISSLGDKFEEIHSINKDEEIHNWLMPLFRSDDIEKIVIEIGNQPTISLKIGYHIRLSMEELAQKSLIPILYVSTNSLNSIMIETGIYSQILVTKGVYFTEFEIDKLKTEIELIEGLTANDYLTGFLKIIHVQPDETIGRHSLANIWGAYSMDIAANTNALRKDADFKKKLYFKYIAAFNNIDRLRPSQLKILGSIAVGKANHIIAHGKRILLIDDEADKGWDTVLRKVFKTDKPDDFVVIGEKVKDYNEFSDAAKKIIENNQFDLYLIDLRLNGLDEESTLKTNDFSGTKVMKKIKSLNPGNQVIVFTASNKVWNLKALLDEGADGYYMKESPEFNFTREFSEQNFKRFQEDISQCFNRTYLKEIYESWDVAFKANGNSDKAFIKESNSMLDIAWNLIRQGQLDFGFLTLFQIVETFSSRKYEYVDNSIEIQGVKNYMITDNGTDEIWKLTFNRNKINGDFFSTGDEQKNKGIRVFSLYKTSCILKFRFGKDDTFLQEFGKLNELRNSIAHKGVRGFATKDAIIKTLEIITLFRH